jgi:biopolymer transport protein ExbD
MLRRRSKGKHGREAVELNLAAMLDMAFQLLTFFILTFRPAQVEGEIALRLPQAAPRGSDHGDRIGDNELNDPLAQLDSLTIRAIADSQGDLAILEIEEQRLPFDRLDSRLKALLTDRKSALRQVVIRAASRLRYDALMQVVDVCSRQKLVGGEALKRLCFVETADEDG